MSIQTQIERISGNVTSALSAISEKGVTVPDGSNSDALAGLIRSIETGSRDDVYETAMKASIEREGNVVFPNELAGIGVYAFAYGYDSLKFPNALPDGITYIYSHAFDECYSLKITAIPASVNFLGDRCFGHCQGLSEITFKGTPSRIYSDAFYSCNHLLNINVPWAEGAVANAPWGATNATINYNYTGE